MVAALMAINALSIDVMLPALPEIARSFAIGNENDRQLVVVVYVVASGAAQLFYGPLADALGRRPVLLGGLGGYLVGTLLCLFAGDFQLFLAARLLQGACAAATRVVAMALVRDLVAGARMAQLMSTAMMVFMIVPIIGPGLGQLILFAGSWRWIFAVLLAAGALIGAWSYFRVPETLPRERRAPLEFAAALRSYRLVAQSRTLLGYAIAQTLMFSAMFSFLASSQQVFVEVFAVGPWFPLAFASVAGTLSIAQFSNSRLVTRVGLRRLSHLAGVALPIVCALHLLVALTIRENIWLFLALLLPMMFTFAFTGPNYNAIAMEPMGERAGAAASFVGFMTTVGGAVFGGIVGHLFDGTQRPMLLGQAVLSLASLLAVVITERGRLFRAQGSLDRP